jgi:hypothetical protein
MNMYILVLQQRLVNSTIDLTVHGTSVETDDACNQVLVVVRLALLLLLLHHQDDKDLAAHVHTCMHRIVKVLGVQEPLLVLAHQGQGQGRSLGRSLGQIRGPYQHQQL